MVVARHRGGRSRISGAWGHQESICIIKGDIGEFGENSFGSPASDRGGKLSLL